ncbi:MAG: O-antigen ligase family protein [Bacillota bacterium]
MYWFIMLFPFMIYPWGSNPIFTTAKPIYLQLFVLLFWLLIILKRKYKSIPLGDRKYTVEIILTIFTSIVCLSTFFSVAPMSSIFGNDGRYEGAFTIWCYLSILIFSYRFLDEKQLKNIIPGIVIVSIFVSSYGILQHYLLDFLPRSSARIGYDRSYAFFGNPNFFGSYLVIIIMLGITLYLTAKKRVTSLFYLLSTSIGFVALIFSGTRSGWVGILFAILFSTIVLIIKRKYLWKRWATLLVTLVTIVLIINYGGKEDYKSRVNALVVDTYKVASNQSSGHEGSSRFFIWEKSMPLIKEYFWTGSGPDTFKYVFSATPDELQRFFGVPNIIVDKAHNEYLQIAVTLGVPALLLYLTLILAIINRAFQAVKFASEKEKIFIFGLLSAIFGYLVQAFFNISEVSVAPFFWCLLGITLAKSENCVKNKKHNLSEPVETSDINQST